MKTRGSIHPKQNTSLKGEVRGVLKVRRRKKGGGIETGFNVWCRLRSPHDDDPNGFLEEQ